MPFFQCPHPFSTHKAICRQAPWRRDEIIAHMIPGHPMTITKFVPPHPSHDKRSLRQAREALELHQAHSSLKNRKSTLLYAPTRTNRTNRIICRGFRASSRGESSFAAQRKLVILSALSITSRRFHQVLSHLLYGPTH